MTQLAEAAVPLCERYAVADVDSHIIEPADLWTSRVSSKWGDLVPHVKFDERTGEDSWYIGSKKLFGVGAFAQAGMEGVSAVAPRRTLSEALPAAVDPKERLAYMDERRRLLPAALLQHPRVPQPRLPQPDGAAHWPPSACGPTTTG